MFVMLLGLGWSSDVSHTLRGFHEICLNNSAGLMRACELLEPEYLVQMLKAVKHLSMNASLLEVLQNANAIEILVRILGEHSAGLHSTVSNALCPYSPR